MPVTQKASMFCRRWLRPGVFFALGLVLLLNMALVYRKYQMHMQEFPGALVRITGKKQVSGEVVRGRSLEQDFWLDEGEVAGFSLEFATYGKTSQGKAQVRLYREKNPPTGGTLLGEWTLQGQEIPDNQTYRFTLPSPVQVQSGGERFRLEVTSPDGLPGNSFSVYRTEKDLYLEGTLKESGRESTDLCLDVYQSSYPAIKYFFVLLALYSAAILAFSYRCAKSPHIPLERIVFCLALLLGTAYMFVMPPNSAPDEPAHFATAYAYANRILGQEAVDATGHAYVRRTDMVYNESQKSPTAYSYQLFWENLAATSGDTGKVPFGSRTLSGVWPVAYVPQILGILLSRLLHLGGVPLFMAARGGALLFYAACCCLAVKRMPFAKGVLALAALLPMSLELGASCSYDCMMLALAYVFIGQVFSYMWQDGQMKWKDWGVLAGIAVLLTPLKIVYWPLFAICLFIPASKCPSVKNMWAGRACVLGGGLASLLANRFYDIVFYLTRTSFTGQQGQWKGISLHALLSDPAMGIRMLAESLRSQGDFYLSTAIGGKLGWLDTDIPNYLVYGFWLLLLLATVEADRDEKMLDTGRRLALLGISAVVILAVFTVFLLTWTEAGAESIDGVQGRYFLPVLPLLLLSLRNQKLVSRENLDTRLLAGAAVLHLFVLWAAFQANLLR